MQPDLFVKIYQMRKPLSLVYSHTPLGIANFQAKVVLNTCRHFAGGFEIAISYFSDTLNVKYCHIEPLNSRRPNSKNISCASDPTMVGPPMSLNFF